jgi:hypothetical protein
MAVDQPCCRDDNHHKYQRYNGLAMSSHPGQTTLYRFFDINSQRPRLRIVRWRSGSVNALQRFQYGTQILRPFYFYAYGAYL